MLMVTIMGLGQMGTALSVPLRDKGRKVRLASGTAREANFPRLFHAGALLNQGAMVDIPWVALETEDLLPCG